MKRVALVTNFFYPVAYIGSNRMEAFATYLADEYEVTVFAEHRQWKEYEFKPNVKVFYSPSNGLLDRLKNKNTDPKLIHYTKTLTNIILRKVIRNPLAKWQKRTLDKLVKAHQAHPFDVIISSFPYIESHLAVMDFLKQFPDVKWIADMRDEMSFNPNHSQAVNDYMRGIEVEINRNASAVISVSGPIIEEYVKHLPDVPVAEEVRNGFNHDLTFEQVPDPNPDGTFKFGYFGRFYGVNKPDNFFQALLELPEYTDYEFHIYGAFANFSTPPTLKDRVFVYPSLAYQDAIRMMNTMDANVVISPISTRKGVYTGKLFDYISARKPVLGLVSETDLAGQLIYDMKCGYVSDNNDIEGIKKGIVALLNDKKNGISHIASPEDIATLHRSHGVKKLKEVIEHILA